MTGLLLAALLAVPARADKRIPECGDLAFVASAAGAIVHGTVVKVQAREDKGGMVQTYVMVKVDQVLKGKKVKMLTVKRLGGAVVKKGELHEIADGDGGWKVKVGDAGWLYLTEGKYYGLVCGNGMTQELPKP